ncbi:hypothetical protein ACOI1H_17725 [Loktanella sp. DJP18]|uniref:hypothetical protein n=1 Tax=Loktanella sp. DJP18 TaxID=3409788 RepID=UPI003BB6633C
MTRTIELMHPAHQSVARAICYALTLDHVDAWAVLPVILQARLDERERSALAYVALRSMEEENAAKVAGAFASGHTMPLPPLVNYMDEASFWANRAAPAELDAYCLATFNLMTPDRQAAFVDFIQRRAAA